MEDESMIRLEDWLDRNAEGIMDLIEDLEDTRAGWTPAYRELHEQWERRMLLKAMGPTRN
jgi:hypothetical protein